MTPRRGMTIVELLVVIAVQSALLALMAGLFAVLYQADRHGRAQIEAATWLEALGDAFRRDVRAATPRGASSADSVAPPKGATGGESAAAAATPALLVLELPDGRTVRYTIETGGVARVESRGQQTLRRELFRLPAGARATVESAEDAGMPLVRLVVESQRKPSSAPPVRWQFDAMLSRDRRIAPNAEDMDTTQNAEPPNEK
jgi:type II secretory pathway pseudopilin PulG